MKIWWPWQRKKPLSLFEERVAWLGEDSDAKPPRLLGVGTHPHLGPHPMNAAGPFYVGHGDCMACGYPHVLAPDLMAWDMDPEGRPSHCYFKKQPVGPGELKQAIEAVAGSCCGALYYSGSDPDVLDALRQSGKSDAII